MSSNDFLFGIVSLDPGQLNYDKVERGGLSIEYRLIPIWNLVEQTAKEFAVTAKAKEVTIHLDIESPVAATAGEECTNKSNGKPLKAAYLPEEIRQHRLIGDPIRMTQVLRNVISNALKFTPPNGEFEYSLFQRFKLPWSPHISPIPPLTILRHCDHSGIVRAGRSKE